MTDIPQQCSTCEWWAQARDDAFQNPLKGIWGVCWLTKAEATITLTKNTYWCADWMAD